MAYALSVSERAGHLGAERPADTVGQTTHGQASGDRPRRDMETRSAGTGSAFRSRRPTATARSHPRSGMARGPAGLIVARPSQAPATGALFARGAAPRAQPARPLSPLNGSG